MLIQKLDTSSIHPMACEPVYGDSMLFRILSTATWHLLHEFCTSTTVANCIECRELAHTQSFHRVKQMATCRWHHSVLPKWKARCSNPWRCHKMQANWVSIEASQRLCKLECMPVWEAENATSPEHMLNPNSILHSIEEISKGRTTLWGSKERLPSAC